MFLTHSSKYSNVSQDEKDKFKRTLPFQRGTGTEPGVTGYMSTDKTYSSGGRALERAIVKSY
ncbi:hypothetical protein [Flavobacterium sp. 3HN19-14]|uniref:HORMA-1 domain-containing protein n=1 Tax=Flavobacterium sp. 3HN19-14 TaxID=3448133 RepID=UPI003EDF73C2